MQYINKQPRAKVLADNFLKNYQDINKNAASIFNAVRLTGNYPAYSFAPSRQWNMLVDYYYANVVCMEKHEQDSMDNIIAEIQQDSKLNNAVNQNFQNMFNSIPNNNDMMKNYLTSMFTKKVSINKLTVLAVWRFTQGIYSFDDTIINELLKSEISDDIPYEVFKRLPEWCIYIDTFNTEINWNNEKLFGFWITFVTDELQQKNELYVVMDTETGMRAWTVELNGNNLNESLQLVFSNNTIIDNSTKLNIDKERLSTFKKLLSLVLYICSDEPDAQYLNKEFVLSGLERPTVKAAKKGGLIMYPAEKCRNYILGTKTGEAIRTMINNKDNNTKTSSAKRPHIRRGHWHGYWTGARDKEREFKYKWLFPMLIEGNKE